MGHSSATRRGWFSAPAPEIAVPLVMAATTGWLYIAGGIIALLVATSEAANGPQSLIVAAIGCLAATVGFSVLRLGHRLSRVIFHPLVALGSVLITVATLCTTSPTGAVVAASLFTFIAIDAAFYFAPRHALIHIMLALVGISVSLRDRGVPALQISALFLVCMAVGGVTAMLVARASHAERDTLTGLTNRRRFDEAYAAAVTRHSGDKTPLTLGLLDLDDLAVVNQYGGHQAGDDVLRRLAHGFRTQLHEQAPSATIARFGGDEFVLLLPGLCVAEADTLIAWIRREVGVGFSCGLAQLVPGENRAALLRRADTALYQAKAENRGFTCVAEDGEALLAADLSDALQSDPGQITLVHQPIVDLATRDVIAVEALCRWTHPDRGFVSPADFIPAAETAGLIHALGLLVLHQACTDAIRLRQVRPDLVVTVNVSGRQLTRPGFRDDVLNILRVTALPSAALCLEVTESVVDGSSPTALTALQELHDDGLRIAIDDFGTGYSAFSRLDALPAHHLKLDAAFTAGITTSPRRAGILQGLLGICEALNLSVVAEGVETPAQANKLLELGCPLAQGYLFARPTPIEELLPRLTAPSPPPRPRVTLNS